jgi:hypothetical protein
MIYLDASEYGAFGLEKTVPAAWITAASSLIDAHCRRPTLAVAQYVERLRLARGRNTVRLTYLPLATVAPATTAIVAARGRYAVPRRGEESPAGELAGDVAQAFSLPGSWTTIDSASIDFLSETGELTLAMHPLGLSFNEVEITYQAGLATIPDPVKFACAQIVRNAQATPALNVRSGNLDKIHLEYFADTLIDHTVLASLAPYVAQRMG